MSRPFIILADSRKGTHLLQTALQQHGDVCVNDQPFSLSDFAPDFGGDQLAAFFFDGTSPVSVLSLAWTQGRGRQPDFWKELTDRRVGVVHLHRRNMLRWYVSVLIAKQANHWYSETPAIPTTFQVRVDPKEFARTRFADLRYERHGARFFQDHDAIHLWYEDLTAHFDAEVLRVQRFLGVPPEPLRPTCYKQQTRPLDAVIENYQELKKAWNGSPWEWFLRDDLCPCVLPERKHNENPL